MSENTRGARLVVIFVCSETVSLLTILQNRPFVDCVREAPGDYQTRPANLAEVLEPHCTGIQKRPLSHMASHNPGQWLVHFFK